ncbi:MAG: glycosyltransferase [Candidatus Tectomicrobia bacterium]|nr:glycosyltransferase [Candidatus Tectomicrobia bacterium]
MHIGLVTPSFPPMVDGGVAIATGRLVQYLLHSGHQITVLTQPPPAGTPAAAEPLWASLSALTIAYRAIEAPLHDAAGVAALRCWMQERHARCPFDVLLAYFVYPSGYLATLLGEAIGVPVVCSCRGNDISKDMFIDPATLATVLQRSTRLIFVSESLLRMAHTLIPCREKSTIVANSVDCTQFMPAPASSPAPSAPVVLGTSGLMRWKKGIDVLLPLIRELCATRDVKIHIAGYPLDEMIDHQITQFVNQHGLRDRVHILGPLPHERMAEVIGQMHIYVNTSYQEGMPNGVLEAMACALPVVATTADGIPQLVDDGVTGYLCPVGDPETLADSCRRLIDHPDLRSRMGTAGRRRAQHVFHPEREAQAAAAVLRQACEG